MNRYYADLAVVDDVVEPEDDVLKVAVFDFGDVESGTVPALAPFRNSHQVVVCCRHWIDIMAVGVNKGTAVRGLQRELGITRGKTAAFGDYLNDLELLDAAGPSFAMANAHPEVLARAHAIAPSNTEGAIVTVLAQLLAADALA